MKGLVGGPQLVGGLGPLAPPLKSGPGFIELTVMTNIHTDYTCDTFSNDSHLALLAARAGDVV